MTLEQFYKQLKEHGLIGYNWPHDDAINISRKAAGSAPIQIPKDATSWRDVFIKWDEFHRVFLFQAGTVLQLVSEYLQDNRKQAENARYCLACPTSDHRYITDINSDGVFDCSQNTEMRFVFSTSDEPRWYSAIEAMKVKE